MSDAERKLAEFNCSYGVTTGCSISFRETSNIETTALAVLNASMQNQLSLAETWSRGLAKNWRPGPTATWSSANLP